MATHTRQGRRRALARSARQAADLGSPVTPMLAHMLWRGRSMGQIFDHRETEMGLCQLARTVSESVEERWRDGVGSLPDLGYPVMLAHMLGRAVDGTDFRASRSGGGREPAAAHSRRECGRAMARRRGQFAGPWVSGHACTHGPRDRFWIFDT